MKHWTEYRRYEAFMKWAHCPPVRFEDGVYFCARRAYKHIKGSYSGFTWGKTWPMD